MLNMRALISLAVALPFLFGATASALETAPASLVEVDSEFRLDGVVEAVNRSTIAAQTSAQVEEILFDVDDYVEKGSVIVVLKNSEQQAGADQAAANLRAARARLAQAEAEYARISDLFDRELVSRQQMDNIAAERKTARAALEAEQARASQAGQQLEYTQVRAPYSGIVTARHVEVGEIAQPGTPLMSGISLEQLRVSVAIPQGIVGMVRENRAARVLVEGTWLQATGVTVFPVTDNSNGSFRTRLALPTGQPSLFPGMLVKTSFITGREKILAIPRTALVSRSEVSGVYILEGSDDIRFRHVRHGRTLPDGLVGVLSGLHPGERVALDPGAAVTALKTAAETADE